MEFFSIVAHRVATRVFVGDDLCRNLHFLQISQAFLNSIFTTALVIVKLPLGPFRNLLSFPLSQIHAWRLRRCHRILLPIVKKRIEEIKSIKGGSQDSDAIDWTLHLATEKLPCNTPQMITRELLYSLWAASSAPGGMITEIIYQLLSTPEYLEPLRLEARSAVENHGWSEKMLSNLPMQDSFIREVNRLYPTGSSAYSHTNGKFMLNVQSYLHQNSRWSAIPVLGWVDSSNRDAYWLSNKSYSIRCGQFHEPTGIRWISLCKTDIQRIRRFRNEKEMGSYFNGNHQSRVSFCCPK